MKSWIYKPVESTQEVQSWIDSVARSGQAAVKSALGSLPFCASLTSSATEQCSEAKEDLIHYFLIPCCLDDSGFVLFSKRQLPAGVGTENDLPKFSVFHVPNTGAEQKLEAMVLGQLAVGVDARGDLGDEPLDQRLERVANEIEKHSYYVTGGILLIGGIVACANPVLGVGIAAKALFPSLGAKLSSEVIKLGGGKLRRWRERGDQKRSEKLAKAQLNQRKARLVVNPLLAKLQMAIDTTEREYDPSIEDPFLRLTDGFPEGLRRVTLEVVSEYYDQIELAGDGHALDPEDRRWLEMIRHYVQDEQD